MHFVQYQKQNLMVTIVHTQMGRWQIAVVSTFFNTHPFAFRWKNEQGYLDNCGPN